MTVRVKGVVCAGVLRCAVVRCPVGHPPRPAELLENLLVSPAPADVL